MAQRTDTKIATRLCANLFLSELLFHPVSLQLNFPVFLVESLLDQTASADEEGRRKAALEAVQSDSLNTFDWQSSQLFHR